MKKQSAGILLYKTSMGGLEVLLVHPGGPFWAKKDIGCWSIPKGEFTDEEDPQSAAKREFQEELGVPVPEGDLLDLGSAKQASGKVVYAWAIEADLDAKHVKSNTFEMEWPPKSGRMESFPEVNKAAWLQPGEARLKIVKGQVPLLEKLVELLGLELPPPAEEAPVAPEPTATPPTTKPSKSKKGPSIGQTSLF